jgi:demethylmenaquinone methyltransferase/2-methoxy-6-polyprenyl-1,4-benzoquinol methylase
MHIVSSVEGNLRAGHSAVDVFRATFPAGTLSGAPKPRALEIIDELEPAGRGVYGGVVGYFDFAGNADLAIAMCEKLHPQEIIGIDIAPKMLEIGRSKVNERQLNSVIRLEDGDSQDLQFEDNRFDAVTAAFGVRNFENLEKGLSEMYRVLKPKGKFVVLEFSRPTLFPFKAIFNAYFKYLLPLIGRFTSNDRRAYAYLYESVQVFPEGQELLNIFEKIGFKSNQCTVLTLGVCSIYVGFK